MTSVQFRPIVEPARGGGHVVEVDRALAERIGAKHMTRVRGTLDGTAYRSNVASMGGRLVLGVHKATLQAAGRETGDTVVVTMELDTEPRRRTGEPRDDRRACARRGRATGRRRGPRARPACIVIVWNDPINLMTYVTWVFMRLFGYPREKAEKLMWDVHTKGRAVVSSGPLEKAESDVARLHAHGLWATLEKES